MRRDEQLSALMDDELSKDELRFLLKGLETDTEGREKWRRYHDIGDALRDEPEQALSVDLSARVMAQIAEEQAQAAEATNEPAWMKRVVSFAVAASVATVAVFVANDRGLIGANQGAHIAGTSTAAAVASADASRQSDVADWQQVSPEVQEKINQFLGTEDSFATDPDIASQIRLVGHRQDEEQVEEEVIEPESDVAQPQQ